MFGGKPRVGGNAPFQRQRRRRVEFAIDQSVDHQLDPFRVVGQSVVAHGALPSSDISRLRARASRDITVPIATPSMTDISR